MQCGELRGGGGVGDPRGAAAGEQRRVGDAGGDRRTDLRLRGADRTSLSDEISGDAVVAASEGSRAGDGVDVRADDR